MSTRRPSPRPRASGTTYMRFSSARVSSKRATPPHAIARPSSSRTTRKTPSGSTNIDASRFGPMSFSPAYESESSACCAAVSATASGESKGSGPETLKGGVERDGGDLVPEAVADADDERLVDVEVDAVARADCAVDGDRPVVVG